MKIILTKISDRIMQRLALEVTKHQIQQQQQHAKNMIASLRSCGNLVRFNGDTFISAPSETHIGNNVHIGNNAYFKTEGGLHIGDNTHISRDVTIYTTTHNYQGSCLPYDDKDILKPVIIGKNVWIGMNVSIAPGVTIGEGAIIALGAVVARDVPPLAIIGSQPFRLLKQRNQEHYENLETRTSYGGINGKPLSTKET